MADVAHDASSPSSPGPGDIAPQQAIRPDSPDRGKLRVFISYSRDDLEFADQLVAALNAYGFECFIDRHGIPGGEEWKPRLGNLISEADTVVFVLSPTSARSKVCAWEVGEAERLGKRILPANCRPLEGASAPPQLRDRNYILFYKDPKASDSGFGTGLAILTEALSTDFDWLREHTRYLQRAIEWDRGGRPANRLLSGNDIAEAKAWVARRPKNAPEPTALHLDFIRASEEEAEARSSAQRKQLEAMAAAQAERETALRAAEEAQRKRATMARIRNIALVAVSILALLVGWFAWSTEQQKRIAEERRLIAEEQKAVAEVQRNQADRILTDATAIIANLWDKIDTNTQKRVYEVFRTGVDHDDLASMRNLGILYENGFGVPKNYDMARKLYEKAADKGDVVAMVNLGNLYANGRGVVEDSAKARELYEKAADKGNALAMAKLGLLYNMAEDYAEAREWYKKAANGGDADAMFYLAVLYQTGKGGAQDAAKAREWYGKAADGGNAQAMMILGVLYEYDEGDYARARVWYEKAADNGGVDAKDSLERLAIKEAARAGRYADALQLQEALTAKVEEVETKREGKPGKETAEALHGVARLALLARDFAKALTVSNRAHALFPDDLAIESVRAHALLFLGHREESKALYLAHKGKPVPEQSDALWERLIVEDFAEFRNAGLTHPMMAEIEKELGVSP